MSEQLRPSVDSMLSESALIRIEGVEGEDWIWFSGTAVDIFIFRK